jgi:PPK2 family polyphosphate:nucleotide phosphotransferase
MKPILFQPVESPHLVPFDGALRIDDLSTEPPDGAAKKKENEAALEELRERFARLQRRLYADGRFALLLVFQAMDAAGKDGTVREVMRGVNPAGCQVKAFKAPSPEELAHDFLWRVERALPERRYIGIFNRSHYEEVLVVRVNPKFLDAQHLPHRPADLGVLWKERYQSILDAEQHWARGGTAILKFYLHVSKDEQKKRILERIDDPEDHWKFNAGDLVARSQWTDYMAAYQDALAATSRPWAPWYAIPADAKHYMRRTVAEIVVATLERLDPRYPPVSEKEQEEMRRCRRELASEPSRG